MWLLISLGATTAFAVWVVFLGGAEQLEGSITSALLFHPMAPMLTATHLKAYAIFAWLAQMVTLLLTAL